MEILVLFATCEEIILQVRVKRCRQACSERALVDPVRPGGELPDEDGDAVDQRFGRHSDKHVDVDVLRLAQHEECRVELRAVAIRHVNRKTKEKVRMQRTMHLVPSRHYFEVPAPRSYER